MVCHWLIDSYILWVWHLLLGLLGEFELFLFLIVIVHVWGFKAHFSLPLAILRMNWSLISWFLIRKRWQLICGGLFEDWFLLMLMIFDYVRLDTSHFWSSYLLVLWILLSVRPSFGHIVSMRLHFKGLSLNLRLNIELLWLIIGSLLSLGLIDLIFILAPIVDWFPKSARIPVILHDWGLL
jgi:hypothetical protein